MYATPAFRSAATRIGVSAGSGAKAHHVYRLAGLWLTMALAAGACGGTATTTLPEVEPVQPSLLDTADGLPDVKGILDQAQASIDAGQYEEAIVMCARVIALVEDSNDPELEGVPGKEAIAGALSRKAVALWQLDRHEEALVVLEEVDARFRDATDMDLVLRVAWALIMKGLVLGDMGSSEEAIAAFEEALARLGDMDHAELGYHIASALYWKGVYLRGVGWRVLDAAAAFDEVITRFGDSTEPEVIDLVELATQENDEIADLVEQLVAGRDGVWAGATSDGESFSVTLESGGVTAVSFGFDGACSGLSPVSAQSGDRPLGRMGGVGATFAVELIGLVHARIEGSFMDGTAQGTIYLEFGPDCGGPRVVTWQATLPTSSDEPPAEDAWRGKQPPPDLLPTVAIDPELYDPVVWIDGYDQYGAPCSTPTATGIATWKLTVDATPQRP